MGEGGELGCCGRGGLVGLVWEEGRCGRGRGVGVVWEEGIVGVVWEREGWCGRRGDVGSIEGRNVSMGGEWSGPCRRIR